MQHDQTDVRTGVLIVGGGPTGLTLANVLGQGGVPFVLVDQKPATIAEPRAVSIDDESLRTMQSFALEGEVMQDVVPGYGVHYFSKPGGVCFGKVEPTASEYGYPRRNAFRQPLFEATLKRGAERFDEGQVRFGHTLDTFEQDASGVTAIVRAPDGQRVTVRAAFMVACDGGRSPVRESLGIKMVGSTFKSRWLVVDTERDTDAFSQMRVYCDARRPIVDVPGPHRTRRYEVLIHPHESADAALDPAQIAAWLRPLRGDTPMHVVRKTVYTFHARVAERWQTGRVFLAGDAAHLTPPYAGQGMNSGVRDAHNLGWKFAYVLKGILPEAILDSYETERRTHAWSLIRLALNLGIVMAPRSRFSALAWQSFFRATRGIAPIRDFFVQMKFKPKPRFDAGLLGPRGSEGGAGVRGRMMPQPLVETTHADRRVHERLDNVIGNRFALVYCGPADDATLSRIEHPLWDLLGAVRVQVLPSDAHARANGDIDDERCVRVVDTHDALRTWLGDARHRVLLVRPDRYVAGTFDPSGAQRFADDYAATLGATLGTRARTDSKRPAAASTEPAQA
ncbi:bifunctional 3-(3-hydroxy-phenyl)propionate/3-hydroxycinnamic acid hydroxylase [Pararobbsia silviterrae]|uniref:Bifunctional 3-(3-hydroxy-phenyl)propionate/3-hydroxycinnamic acid hydroxylase n=1 Tax=Pararobbsia silviterrae TaxID=1792498 RepID=A0A494XSJ7_9BURK|nr:bifunctional 3-(3-hydroxy-phenyl)propionate/3-hydroxycinnamic acid hydroxylase [Pararobbsia silviterrae]RKP53620.1 bifunctional 3-(3-hydroxy-phenyl)propionate/3-hydroxycinnamic acid hydroxylase [Pararobbsia silviterrae]